MTNEEARLIFRSWQEYMETADKFSKLMLTPPASFLPYPVEMLEEALNTVAKEHFDAGDHKTAETIQTTMAAYLSRYFLSENHTQMTDEEALEGMLKMLTLTLSDERLKTTLLENLRASQQSWMEARRTGKAQKPS